MSAVRVGWASPGEAVDEGGGSRRRRGISETVPLITRLLRWNRHEAAEGDMTVVDVDTHWESTASGSNPLKPWKDLLPKDLDRLAFAIAGDLLRALPPDERPDAARLLPGLVRAAEDR